MASSWQNICQKETRSILGLMSGTSCDGLDIAHIEISGSGSSTRFQFKSGQSFLYTKQQRETILGLIKGSHHTLKSLSQFNFYLAGIWAKMIHVFLEQSGLKSSTIDLIGSHGQTIWHQPVAENFADLEISSTWQTGDPSALANLLQIPVVGDFRVADVSVGGQGAPLIPYFDWIYFSQFKKNILAVNIGGISNLTYVSASGEFNDIIAFDSGPGNMLIDQAVKDLFDMDYDHNGKLAAEGEVHPNFIEFIRSKDGFSTAAPPKSSGREYYNSEFLGDIIEFGLSHKLTKHDILSGLTAYTAEVIHSNYKNFIEPLSGVDVVAVGGGGAKNPLLMAKLQSCFANIEVKTVSFFELNEDFKEAIGFAVLANESICWNTSNVPQVTGASKPVILGKICPVIRE